MTIHVTDPEGTRWTVSRRTFDLPPWPRWSSMPEPPPALAAADSLAGFVALSGLFVVVLVVLVIVFALPVLLFLVGLMTAVGLVAARLFSIAPWAVEAHSAGTAYVWRVRGVFRSTRAMREVASALARGAEPTVDGRAGSSA